MFGKQILFIAIVTLTASLAQAGNFTLISPTIKSNDFLTREQVFNGFGCSGKNQSPAQEWSQIPSGTKSFAITVDERIQGFDD